MYYKYNKDIITHAQAQAVIDSLIRVVLHPLGVLLGPGDCGDYWRTLSCSINQFDELSFVTRYTSCPTVMQKTGELEYYLCFTHRLHI